MTYEEAQEKWPEGFCLFEYDGKVYYADNDRQEAFLATDEPAVPPALADHISSGFVDLLFILAMPFAWVIGKMYSKWG